MKARRRFAHPVSITVERMPVRLPAVATLLCATALALPIPLATASSATTTAANSATAGESGNPINDQGSNFEYRSTITTVTPSVPGLSLEVLEFADRLLLTNHTGKTVTIYGYQGEPYARVLANGTAEENTRSPATYLNTSFYGNVTVPAFAEPERRAALGGRRPHRPVRMARPPHPLDVAVDAPAGQGQEQAHADLRLAGADPRRDTEREPSRGSCSGRPRARAHRPR